MHHHSGRGRLAATIISLALLGGAMAIPPATALAYGGDGLRDAANAFRADAGLPPVVGTALLDDIASHRASQMVRLNRLEHDIDYVTRRLNDAGVCWKVVGEILAWERGWPDYDSQRTAQAWFDSPTHHDIMLGTVYNAAGGAWLSAPDMQHFSVMVFVELCGTSTTAVSLPTLRPDQRYDPDRPLVLGRGRQTGYKLSADGIVIARRTVWYEHRTRLSAGGRARVADTAYLKVSSGKLRGYWVREGYRSYVMGMTACRRYDSPRSVTLAAGRYRGYRFDRLGRVTDTRARTYDHVKLTAVTARAVINGRTFVRFAAGRLADYWVRDTGAIAFQ